ncbi:hypothetical protein DLAC_04841 [Tieghemostelium lacteum]|uniref:Uncharacterized protein n=1 Tax=Tieghemostelium lacteum TaxID=361077 RepID=A0A151ZIY4_TIELA|nr:hypothetical protein DLAC_04841 [Tieghemostelium lacteum]|eukprot:KYQ93952.1 hypothetical protein DLAC_04841 [Tieghemostelium lacteum]
MNNFKPLIILSILFTCTIATIIENAGSDDCLSVSAIPQVVNTFDIQTLLTALQSAATFGSVSTTLAPIIQNVINLPADTLNAMTSLYWGFSNNNFYMLRNCLLHENSITQQCISISPAPWALFVRNQVIQGDNFRHVYAVSNQGVVSNTSSFTETTEYFCTQRVWFAQKGWQQTISATTGDSAYTFSGFKGASATLNYTVASDRSFREKCNTCLTNSYANGVVETLDQITWTSPTTFSDVSAIVQKLFTTKFAAQSAFSIQLYIGFSSGAFIEIKDCTQPEFYGGAICGTESRFVAIVGGTLTSDLFLRSYPINADGTATNNLIFTTNTDYNVTIRPWYVIGKSQTYGWSAPYQFATTNMVGRTFVKSFTGGVVAADFTPRECDPVSATTVTFSQAESRADTCLNSSTLITDTNSILQSAKALANLSNMNDIQVGITNFFNALYLIGGEYVASYYVGFSNGDTYLIRDCNNPEAFPIGPCQNNDYVVFIRNFALQASNTRWVYALSNTGVITPTTPLAKEGTVYNPTGRLWYTTPNTWNLLTSFTTGAPTLVYSVSFTGGVVAIDRSFREPCNSCLNSATNKATTLTASFNTNSGANLGTLLSTENTIPFLAIAEVLYNTSPATQSDLFFSSYTELAYGFINCANAYFALEAYCAATTRTSDIIFWATNPTAFGDQKQHYFNTNANGVPSTASYFASTANYYPLTTQWYTAGVSSLIGEPINVKAFALQDKQGRKALQFFKYGVIGSTDTVCNNYAAPTPAPTDTPTPSPTISSATIMSSSIVVLFLTAIVALLL